MKAAVVQFQSELGQAVKNAEHISVVIDEVMKHHPDCRLIVFPEMCLYGYAELERLNDPDYCEKVDSALKRVCAAAGKNRVPVVAGFGRRDKVFGGLYNSIAYISRDGNIVCTYDKMHLIEQERTIFEKGHEYVQVETEFGKVGMLICWDCIFPEPSRLYAMNGVSLLIVSAAWEHPFEEQWETALKARALDNGIFVLGANRVGQDGPAVFPGGSMAIDGLGRIVARTSDNGTSYAVCDIDTKIIRPEQAQFGAPLRDLRRQSYDVGHIKSYRG